MINIIVLFDLIDPGAPLRRFFPHGHLAVPEEENVDLARHLSGFLHVDVIVEEVFDGGDLAERLQLIAVALLNLGTVDRGHFWLRGRNVLRVRRGRV